MKIGLRDATTLIRALGSGVVPRVGLRHIAVGRKAEVEALLADLLAVEQGGAAFRIVSGRYGSGKSFLLQLIRNNAMDRGFVVLDADLSPERLLTGNNGKGVATYRELVQHMAVKARPDGGALESVIRKWIVGKQGEIARRDGLAPTDPSLITRVRNEMADDLSSLAEMAYGYSFGLVLDAYWYGMKTGDDEKINNSLRWLRGEYGTKTEARKDLGVDRIIDDLTWYDFLKLFSTFSKMAGYKGVLVFLDETVNLYKLSHAKSRENNYEKILTIFNDTMQGRARNIGVILSGTPEFIMDERRGLYSYEALRSRLLDNRYSNMGYVDYSGPIIKLQSLTNEELYLLLERVLEVHEAAFNWSSHLGEAELLAFLQMSMNRIGAGEFMTPREMTKDFIGLLNILYQNPDARFDSLIDTVGKTPAATTSSAIADEYAEFEL